jgi:hypothetical protein
VKPESDERPPVGGFECVDQLVGIDVAQDVIEHHHGDRNDGQTEHDADSAQANLAVEVARGPAQFLQHAALRTGYLRIHQTSRSATAAIGPH